MGTSAPIYMDYHATTPVDRAVLEAMLPYFCEKFGNAGSVTHPVGWEAQEVVDTSRKQIAQHLGASSKELIFTSGATESNNLALFGLARQKRRKGNHIVSAQTEHKAILDPLKRLTTERLGVTLLEVGKNGTSEAGRIDLGQLREAIGPDTFLVTIMAGNNEVGTLEQLAEIGKICNEKGALFHCDATQVAGKIDLDVKELGMHLLSLSAHKIYGPKGVGLLYVSRRAPVVRLEPLFYGGGHENNMRSGTLNVGGIVGLAKALELSLQKREDEERRLFQLRKRLFEGFQREIPNVILNGPSLDDPAKRLAGNLNCQFVGVEGQSLMMSMRELAVSSGSACTAANPEPSHVLRALGIADDHVRSSLRFGLGRFTTKDEVDRTIVMVAETVERLRQMSCH
ncbi:MAG: cysteine desulfurase [Pirellulaceae bacterium]|nr:cysteine desulfurase [Pirellulaceae bacterium]